MTSQFVHNFIQGGNVLKNQILTSIWCYILLSQCSVLQSGSGRGHRDSARSWTILLLCSIEMGELVFLANKRVLQKVCRQQVDSSSSVQLTLSLSWYDVIVLNLLYYLKIPMYKVHHQLLT